MFTGIVQGVANIQKINDNIGLRSVAIAFPKDFCRELAIGASVAVDGVCLTVTQLLENDCAEFDIMQQTLNITTLESYAQGMPINVERAAKQGVEIGGHPLSGHVDCVAELISIRQLENNYVLRIQVPTEWMQYVFAKGYIAINGASLTISEIHREEHWFEVWLIPETLRMTVFGMKKVGDFLNIEIERSTQVIVDTVRLIMQEKFGTMMPAIEALLVQQGKTS
jgi:riboflavin synthase